TFLSNIHPVESGRGASTNTWSVDGRGNHWEGALALDLDRDGIADTPHREPDLFGGWRRSFPAVGLLSASPGERLLRFIHSRLPLPGVPGINDPHPLLNRPTAPCSSPATCKHPSAHAACSPASTSPSNPARSPCSSAPTAPARPPPCASSPASPIPTPAPSPSPATTCAATAAPLSPGSPFSPRPRASTRGSPPFRSPNSTPPSAAAPPASPPWPSTPGAWLNSPTPPPATSPAVSANASPS